jgi:hypothetical protein
MRALCAIALAGTLCLLGSDRHPNPRTLPRRSLKNHSRHHRPYDPMDYQLQMRFCLSMGGVTVTKSPLRPVIRQKIEHPQYQ